MRFELSEEQQEIRRSARDLLASRLRPERLRELSEARAYDDDTLRELCRLGWIGIAVSEENGGVGLGVIELAVLQEELGYRLAPVPFLSNAVVAASIDQLGSTAQRERWLEPLMSGAVVGCVGFLQGDRAALVPDAPDASLFVLLDDEQALLAEADELEVIPRVTMDRTRHLGSVRVTAAGERLTGDVERVRATLLVALAAECVGVAQRTLEMAVSYARDRQQFGRPIAVNQAVSHRCAQMFLETESARSAVYFAAWSADHDRERLAGAAAAAAAYCSDTGWRVPSSALQVHGGIGFTWEHDLHLFLKRGRVNSILYGTSDEHRERVAQSFIAAEKQGAGR